MWAQVPREAPITAGGRVFVEGMSARYVPIFVTDKPRIAVTPPNGIRVAAWLVRDDGGSLASGIELAERDGVLSATVEAMGGYTLVVTGLSRNTIATAVEVALTPPVEEEPPPDENGGCSAAGGSGAGWAAILGMLIAVGRRRRSSG
jgi:MYXO-CTERM domain-containing protein